MLKPAEILAFWFAPGREAAWFDSTPAFDAACELLRPAMDAAAAGELDRWSGSAEGSLALVLLLDQAPRNLHRGRPEAFAADLAARRAARRALRAGHDLAVGPRQRFFLYLPFEHSEDLVDQWLSVALFATLDHPVGLDYARRHAEVIERFGRFPHRNEILGRGTTPEEASFLQEPMSRF